MTSAPAPARLHLPSLAVGIGLMVAGTVDPRLLANAAGQADHGLAMLVFWAMSAGFVRGVGFMPRLPVLRMILSGWACLLALALFVLLRGAL